MSSRQEERPIITIKKQRIDYILEYGTLLGLIFIWTLVAINYSSLPQIIPTHYNLQGQIDDYGSKMTLWILPTIVTLILILFKVLSYYPHKFNYAIKISNDNAERQYKLSLRTLRIIGFNITLLFSFISYKISKPVSDGSLSLEWWFIPLLLISLITPTIYLVVASNSKKRN